MFILILTPFSREVVIDLSPLFPSFFIRKGLFTYECNHVHVTNAVNSALQFTLGSEKALLCFKRIPALSPVLEWMHVLHALSLPLFLCIVLGYRSRLDC